MGVIECMAMDTDRYNVAVSLSDTVLIDDDIIFLLC